jgi:hypothetical protein
MTSASEQRVIVGHNGSERDPDVVRTAMDLARALGTVLYAVEVQPRRKKPAAIARWNAPQMQDAYFALSKAGGLPDDVDVRIVVVDGDPANSFDSPIGRPTSSLSGEQVRKARERRDNSELHRQCELFRLVVPPRLPIFSCGTGSSREGAAVGR